MSSLAASTSPPSSQPIESLPGMLHARPSDSSDPNTPPPKPIRPGLTVTEGGDQDGRRPSIQFKTHAAETSLLTASPKPYRSKQRPKRITSPPPPSTYENRVSFDTFVNRDATDFSFTLKSKHRHYAYSRRSRTFLCGTDQNDYSEFALEWLLDELVDDGDEVVCLRVVDKDSKINSDSSLEEQRYRTEAHKLLEHIKDKNKDEEKAISLILEFAVGKVQETIQRMITIYEPACLIVGTRGRSLGGVQGLLPGSVSKYCLQNSPVPVIVVRPSSKREKKKQKRQADPNRRGYSDILERSGAQGIQVLDRIGEKATGTISGEADANETIMAVTETMGLRAPAATNTPHSGKSSLADVSEDADGAESPSPTGALSPDGETRSPSDEDVAGPDGGGGGGDGGELPDGGGNRNPGLSSGELLSSTGVQPGGLREALARFSMAAD